MRLDRLLIACSICFALACGGGESPGSDAGSDAGSPEVDSGSPETDSGPGEDAGMAAITIFAVQDAEHPDHPAAGETVEIEGVIITAVDTYTERPGVGFVGDVWVADPAGGAFSGLHVYMPTATACAGASALARGNVVTVTGTIQEFAVPTDTSGRTVTQLIGGTVTCTAEGDGAGPAPRAMDAATLTDESMNEAWEGVLVRLSAVEARSDPDFFGVFTLDAAPPVDDDLYAHLGPAGDGVTIRDRFTTLTGIFHYMYGRWALYPRDAADVVVDTANPRDLEWDDGSFGCADGADSDGDGDVDCDDSDCAISPFCTRTRVTVQDVQDETSAMHPAADTGVALVGPLAVTAVRRVPAVPEDYDVVVVQDPSAGAPAFSGIHVFRPTVEPCAADLAVGDRVYVTGNYREFAFTGDTSGRTLSEITGGLVSCSAAGAPLAPALVAVPADLAADATAEPYEGVLVEIRNVTVTMPSGAGGRFVVTGGVNVDDDLYSIGTVATDDVFTRIAGIFTYQNEYQLEPRDAGDVERP